MTKTVSVFLIKIIVVDERFFTILKQNVYSLLNILYCFIKTHDKYIKRLAERLEETKTKGTVKP